MIFLPLDQLVERMISYAALKRPSSRMYQRFKTWVYERKPLSREEICYIVYPDDLVALSKGQEDGSFGGMVEDQVEDVLGWLPRSLIKVGPRLLCLLFFSYRPSDSRS